MLRQPHRRRSQAEWDEFRRLSQAGATAKVLQRRGQAGQDWVPAFAGMSGGCGAAGGLLRRRSGGAP